MLRRLIRVISYCTYCASTLYVVVYFFQLFSVNYNPIPLGLSVVCSALFCIRSIEIYLLKRSDEQETIVQSESDTAVYAFISDEEFEMIRISLLSLKHLRGNPNVIVISKERRSDVESLCEEFKFKYINKNLKFQSTTEQYLITNGHCVLYPDAILVGQRHLGSNATYVELNHSIFASQVSGNSSATEEESLASNISESCGTYSVPIYTGAPILVKSDSSKLQQRFKSECMPTFADTVAASISICLHGTITTQPCCECLSDNEIDHNISSRIERYRVSRKLDKHPGFIDTASGIIRHNIGWIYMRYYWLKTCMVLFASMLVLVALLFGIPKELISVPIFSALAICTLSMYALRRVSGDERRYLNCVRDTILDCEAYVHAISNWNSNNRDSRYRIRHVPFYLCALLVAIFVNLASRTSNLHFGNIELVQSILPVALGALVALSIYKAMHKYLSERQRSFARRSVSITGSSCYESMWIVDLTHRGAAYISDSRLEMGDDTPLVFRVPTMSGDSLITVNGRVAYCKQNDDAYQIGVVFKEISQSAQDDLMMYCSVIYPYHRERNIDDTEINLVEQDTKRSAIKEESKDLLTASIYSLLAVSILSILLSYLPVSNFSPDIKVRTLDPASSDYSKTPDSINSSVYDLSGLTSQANSAAGVVSVRSSFYFDTNNNGRKDQEDNGIKDIGVKLYTAQNNVVNVGSDGVISADSNSNDTIVSDGQGEISYRYIAPGSYYVQLTNVPNDLQLSDISINNRKAVESLDGFRSAIFDVNTSHNGKIEELNIGFVPKYDLQVSQEIIDMPPSGYIPGDVVKMRINVRNDGPSTAAKGYSVQAVLGDSFDADNIQMNKTAGFIPCGAIKNKVKCVSSDVLKPGESASIEYTVTSHVSSSTPSYRRSINATVMQSQPSPTELKSMTQNNSSDIVIPVGNSACIGDRFFFDSNMNGLNDDGEKGIEGIRVGLREFKDINGDGVKDPGEMSEIAHDVTDENGYYGASRGKSEFQNLNPNKEYAISFTSIPKNYSITTPFTLDDGSTPDNPSYTSNWKELNGSEIDLSRDIGLVPTGRNLKSTLFIDANGNNKQDRTEVNITGYEARLIKWVDTNRNSAAEENEIVFDNLPIAKSGQDGTINFENIRDEKHPTYYAVQLDAPKGYEFNRSGYQDKTYPNRIQSEFITSSKFNKTKFALRESGSSISGKLYIDFNRNGVKDAEEYGAYKLKMILLDSANKVVATTYTDKNGIYTFKYVPAGKLYLGVAKNTLPHGYSIVSLGDNQIKEGIVGRKDLPVESKTNTPMYITDLALSSTARVSGKIYSVSNDDSAEVLENAGVDISQHSKIVFKVASGDEGKYYIDQLVPGQYKFEARDNKTSVVTDIYPGSNEVNIGEIPNRVSFVRSVIDGNFQQAAITAAQASQLRNMGMLVVLISLFGAIFTLAKRRKLVGGPTPQSMI